MNLEPCPLCRFGATEIICRDQHRHYRRCEQCKLVFVPPTEHLSLEDEKAIYDYHENDPNDPGYRQFLSRLATPLNNLLPLHSRGLDFGCGPGPTLSLMLREQGHTVYEYDPFYANDPALLEQKYDFICATEVVEHLRQPQEVFERLFSMLRPEGVLGIMTKTIPQLSKFSDWHYTRDLTHIAFYDAATLRHIARNYGYRLDILRSDVAIFSPSGAC